MKGQSQKIGLQLSPQHDYQHGSRQKGACESQLVTTIVDKAKQKKI